MKEKERLFPMRMRMAAGTGLIGLALICTALAPSPVLAQAGPAGQGGGSAAGGPVRLGPLPAPVEERQDSGRTAVPAPVETAPLPPPAVGTPAVGTADQDATAEPDEEIPPWERPGFFQPRNQSAAISTPELSQPLNEREQSAPATPGAQPEQQSMIAPGTLGPGTLGQVPADFEVHGELVLVSGQLEGFNQTCGFGRRPDRDELLQWYQHHKLARNPGRVRGIWELGVELGSEGPCTVEQHQALVGYWEALLTRTRDYVQNYR